MTTKPLSERIREAAEKRRSQVANAKSITVLAGMKGFLIYAEALDFLAELAAEQAEIKAMLAEKEKK